MTPELAGLAALIRERQLKLETGTFTLQEALALREEGERLAESLKTIRADLAAQYAQTTVALQLLRPTPLPSPAHTVDFSA